MLNIEQLAQILNEYQNVKTTHTGNPFNPFEIIRLGDDERKHYTMLAWLLDATANHDQGNLFFDAFIKLCGIDCGHVSHYQVETDPEDSESRPDIKIYQTGIFAIYIETKVNAPEGPDQCAREYRDLQSFANRNSIPNEKVFAVFITPTGREPEEAGEYKNKWMTLSWEQLRGCLGKLVSKINSDKLQYVVTDWLEVIDSFKEEMMDLNSKEAFFLMDNYSSVADIMAADKRLQSALFNFLLTLKNDLVRKPWWQSGWDFGNYSDHEVYVAKTSWKANKRDFYKVMIGVECFNGVNIFTNKDPQKPNLYIWVSDKVEKERDRLTDLIIQHLSSNKKILAGDYTTYKWYPLKRFGLKYTPRAEVSFENTMRNFIVDFIDTYAQVLGGKHLDGIISNW